MGIKYIYEADNSIKIAETNEKQRQKILLLKISLDYFSPSSYKYWFCYNIMFNFGEIPNKINWIIQVEGHTDNVPISTSKFPSNWELSVSRAIAVARIMIDNGIEPNRINVAGYGEFRPLVDNQNKDNRKKNRRIELKLTQP